MNSFTPPVVDWLAVAPVLAVLGTGVIGVLIEAFVPRKIRRTVQLALSLIGLLVAFVPLAIMWGGGRRAALIEFDAQGGGVLLGMSLDQVTIFLQIGLVVMGAMSILLFGSRGGGVLDSIAAAPATRPESAAERAAERAGRQATEIFPLTMFSIGGMMIICSANDLLTMFVALEVLSLPLYILCGLARHQRLRSQEASLKYFLLGAFSSAFFLFGMVMMYGYAGTLNLSQLSMRIADPYISAVRQGQTPQWEPFVLVALLLMLVGLLFKVGAVPFHSWTPDVYEGAPTPVSAFMAACTKAAAFGALLRLMLPPVPTSGGVEYPGVVWFFSDALQPALIVISILTMVVGSAVAIRQTDVKRMLGYSSVAHAGFILCGLASFDLLAIPGVLFYVLVYGLSSIAAFGIVSLVRVRNEDGSIGPEAKNLSQWDGLGRRSPLLAAFFSILMLAFAGFPLTSGFIAKYGVFSAAVSTGRPWLIFLAVVGVVMSAVAASFYLRVIVRMYFADHDAAPTVTVGGGLTMIAVTVGVVATIAFGVYPDLLLDVAGTAMAAR